ncbi:MAG: hypothetical protein Q7J29_02585 [Stagnimonas sp.]|nr:hypothetical protein [Stagnimonas sp.]
MTDSLHDDADDLLHWLNAHSVSISDGIPFSVMQQKWSATNRPLTNLRSSLEWLFGRRLLVMTPGLEQPHVRLTTQGFEQLLLAMDGARQQATVAMTAPVQASVAAPAPFNPAPLAPAAAAPVATAVMPEATEPATPPSQFIPQGASATEIGLRNQVLMIFRDLKLSVGQQLIATTLTRYWQEMGQRADLLRAAIDVMLRDGYLQPAVKRYENYWMLTADGHAYIKGPLSDPALLAVAKPLLQIEESYPDVDLRRKALGLFKRNAEMLFISLELNWRHSRDALIHALDLLVKSGELQVSTRDPLTFRLSPQGAARRR